VQGNPEFKEGAQQFRSKEMRYSFETRKGLIKEVITQKVTIPARSVIKKLPDDVINIRQGKYTTCSLDHPHLNFGFLVPRLSPEIRLSLVRPTWSSTMYPCPLHCHSDSFPIKKVKGVVC
jgi:hypothetical protein